MKKQGRIGTVFLYIFFICYLLFLGYILFFSRTSLFGLFDREREFSRSVNLIPFGSINAYLAGSETAGLSGVAFQNVIGNIVIFIPLGVYLPLLKKDRRIIMSFLIILAVSLCTEIIQWLFGIGATDVDDILLNVFGGLIGIVLYRLFQLVLREEKRVRLLVTILSIAGLPLIYIFIFVLRFRL